MIKSLVALCILALGTTRLSQRLVNAMDYPIAVRASGQADTSWHDLAPGQHVAVWDQPPETLYVNRDRIGADPLEFVLDSVPASAANAPFVLFCANNLYFAASVVPPQSGDSQSIAAAACNKVSLYRLSALH